MNEVIISTLKHSLMITVFVLFMMVIIENINVQTRNIWSEKLISSPFIQLLLAAFPGITPGCLGAFTVVSLYTHRMMNLGLLLPFSILLANSIVQDGHGMLPLLAESRKDFIKVKVIIMMIALIAGLGFLIFKQ